MGTRPHSSSRGTHLLASLTRDTWGTGEPRFTAVCVWAVTLQEWHQRQHLHQEPNGIQPQQAPCQAAQRSRAMS